MAQELVYLAEVRRAYLVCGCGTRMRWTGGVGNNCGVEHAYKCKTCGKVETSKHLYPRTIYVDSTQIVDGPE